MTTKTPVSPKVKYAALWAALAGVGAAAVSAGAGAIDPSLFASLGAFGPLIASGISTAAAALAGWLAKDKLREQGIEAQNASSKSPVAASGPDTFIPAPSTTEPVSAPSQAPVAAEPTFGDPASTTAVTSSTD